MLHENFVILGFLIASFGSISYIIDTIKGRVKPNRVTFFMWALAPLIAFSAQIQKGVGIQSLMTFAVGFFPLLTLIASFFNKKARWELTAFDATCGALSVLGLMLWLITREGNVAIFFGITADALAAIPTIRKSYSFPETESTIPYATAAISAILTLLTIDIWTFEYYGFPVYILIATSTIATLVHFKIGSRERK